jgi:hypothetical protein
MGAVAGFFGIAVGRLAGYHLVVIYQKRTTNEDLKKTFPARVKLPFDRCYWHDRKQLFDSTTEYIMDKKYKAKSSRESNIGASDESAK